MKEKTACFIESLQKSHLGLVSSSWTFQFPILVLILFHSEISCRLDKTKYYIVGAGLSSLG